MSGRREGFAYALYVHPLNKHVHILSRTAAGCLIVVINRRAHKSPPPATQCSRVLRISSRPDAVDSVDVRAKHPKDLSASQGIVWLKKFKVFHVLSFVLGLLHTFNEHGILAMQSQHF